MQSKIINIVTLGCSKNTVDSEYLVSQLKSSGFKVVFDSNRTDAKIAIINTCGFIGDAKEESIDTILKFANAKMAGKIEHLYVMGCLSERYKKDLEKEIPEVDEFFGVNNLSDIVKAVGGNYKDELIGERELSTPSHYAYLKISEGCDRSCSYCAIPLIRGKHISVPMENLITEAEKLAAKGVKELLVIAQDTTYYGLDLYGKRMLGELLRKLCKVEGIEWIRLHYAYPAAFPEDVIDVMATESKMCKYIDIPFQHSNDRILKDMKRGIDGHKTQGLIDNLRLRVPGITIRTTMIVGYPNETQDDFDELAEFVRRNKFDRLGAFSYSEEEDTYSATNFEDNIPFEEKERRREKLMSIQEVISKENNMKYENSIQRVVIDRKEGEYYIGRTQYDSPEVDQEVLVASTKRLQNGCFYNVRIKNGDTYDLYGEIIN